MGSVWPISGPDPPPSPAASETLPALELRLAECLLAFEFLDGAWPRGRTTIERAGGPVTRLK